MEDAAENFSSSPAQPKTDIQQNPTKLSIRPLIALSLGWVLIYADRLSISPLINSIKNEFNLSFFAVSIVVSVYFLCYVIFTIPSTLLAGKIGYNRAMVLFYLLAAAALALAGLLAYSYYVLVFFIGIHGIGAGAYYPTAYGISSQIVPKAKRGFSTAIINCGMGFGSILGLVIAGPVVAAFSNWQVTLVILSVPTAVTAVILWRYVPSSQNHQRSNINLHQFGRLLRKKNLMLICAAMFCSLYGYWVILTWGPTFLQETRGLNIFYSGLVTGVFSLVAIPSSILIGHYSDRVGRRRLALVVLPIASLTIFFMAFSSSLPFFLLSIAIYGIVGKLTLDPIAVAWVSEICDSETIGPAMALMNVAGMSSSIAAPIITGLLADLTGTLSYGFYFGAIAVATGTLFILLAKN